MTLVCKPCGRGNWALLRIQIVDEKKLAPLLVTPGHTFSLGGLLLRVHAVVP